MKLTGLISLFFLFISTQIFAQSDLALIQNTRPSKKEEFNLWDWKKNLRIGYFGAYSVTTLKKLDDNQYNSDGTKSNMPTNLLSEFSINYAVSEKFSLYSRFEAYTAFGDRNDLSDNDDKNLVTMGDLLLGFQYRAYRSSKLNYAIRITHAHPMSNYSRTRGVESELDWQNFIIWFPTRDLTVLIWNTYRYYIYEGEKNTNRYRMNNRWITNYNFTEKWGIQSNWEYSLQHRSPKRGPRQRKWNHSEVYVNSLAIGPSYKLNNYLTIIPNIEAQDMENIKWETLQFGFTFLGRIF